MALSALDRQRRRVMSNWSYRVVRVESAEDNVFGEEVYELREVYLNDEGEIEDWLDQDVSITAESFEDLADLWDEIALAFEEPVMFVNEDGDLEVLEDNEEEEAEDEE
jgi:hypothetical protein